MIIAVYTTGEVGKGKMGIRSCGRKVIEPLNVDGPFSALSTPIAVIPGITKLIKCVGFSFYEIDVVRM